MIKNTLLSSIEKDIRKFLLEKYSIKKININVDKAKSINLGDFTTNAAMACSSILKKDVMEIGKSIKERLMASGLFEKIDIVRPGFINMFLNYETRFKLVKQIIKEEKDYGQFASKNIKYNIEYVSANPTGSLHIGHARNAALGMTLSNIWLKNGIGVTREYYINDGGSQIEKLGMSTFYRYLQLNGKKVKMAADYYQGEEPKNIAKQIYEKYGDKFVNVSYDKTKIDDEEVFEFFKTYSKNSCMDFIKKDLKEFRIKFDRYYPESNIYKLNLIGKTIKKLGKNVYEKDGAVWLKSTKYNDDKDRVLIKSDKKFTYFLPDIAYHNIKITRKDGVSKLFNIWGADHNSYVVRMTAALQCFGFKPDIIHVIIMQMVKLTKNGEEFKMSKRSGQSLTLRDLISTIGVDSSRWLLVSQASEAHLEIDVQQFKNKSYDEHLYYVFYAYARINKLLQKANRIIKNKKATSFDRITLDKEKELVNMMFYYPHTIENISKSYEVQKLPTFLYNLAMIFHSYYNETKIFSESSDIELLKQRVMLLTALKWTIKSCLALFDIEPKSKL